MELAGGEGIRYLRKATAFTKIKEIQLGPKCFEPVQNKFECHKNLDLVGPKILGLDQSSVVNNKTFLDLAGGQGIRHLPNAC